MPQAHTKQSSPKISYSDYWAAGIAVIPEYIKEFNWSKIYRDNWKPDAETLLEWDLTDNAGYALVTGQPSNIVAIDIDEADDIETKRILNLIPTSPVRKFGSKGQTLFYRYNGEKNTTFQKGEGVDKRMVVEIISTGKRTTIPPSLHRYTHKNYIWLDRPLLEAHAELPMLPSDIIESLDAALNIVRTPPKVNYPRSDYEYPENFDEVIRALDHCNPNCMWDEWVKIGLSLKSKYEHAFDIFDSWSSRSKKYPGSAQAWKVWKGFNPRSVTISTLFYFAKLGGYRPPLPEAKTYTATDIDSWEKDELERKAELVQKSNELPAFYLNAPTHIKTITDWILSTSLYPQPIITLGSVMAFLGFIMGRDFEFNSLRSNLYVANIAYSADGKEHINRCIRGLMQQFDMRKNISYGWTSDTAIVEKLFNSDAKVFYLTDELQAALRAIANKSTNSRESAATEKLLQAYTGIEVSTTDYADSKERPTKSVKNPFVTICGYTTPSIFEMCLGSTEVFSGFVGRLTVFRGNEFIPEENPNFKGNAWKIIPYNVIDIIQNIQANRQKEKRPDGNFTYVPKEIPTQCIDLVRDYREKIRLKRNEMRLNGDAIEPVFGRAGEMMLKYAIIASQGNEIKEEHIHWAVSVVEYNLSIICDVAQGFNDNKFERKKNKALEYIMKRGGIIEKSLFTRGCQMFDNARERKEIIDDLIESGKLEVVKLDGSSKSKTGYRVLSGLPSEA